MKSLSITIAGSSTNTPAISGTVPSGNSATSTSTIFGDGFDFYRLMFRQQQAHVALSRGPSPTSAVPLAIASNLSALFEGNVGEELRKRLVSLAADREVAFRTNGERLPLSPESVRVFLEFSKAAKKAIQSYHDPEIAVEPKGALSAEWVKDADNFIFLAFDDDGDVMASIWRKGKPLEGVFGQLDMKDLVGVLKLSDPGAVRG